MSVRLFGATVALTLLVTASVSAHHTIAAVYDVGRIVTLNGVVAQVDWRFPHVIVHLDAKNADGSVTRWDVETKNPQGMGRAGLNEEFVKVGEAVTMVVFIAKDGTRHAALETITTSNGTTNITMVPHP
jgi:hypothetical protein